MSSRRHIRRKTCGRKVRHTDETGAWRHLRSLSLQQDDRGLKVYRCRFCHGWHVGHGGRQWP